MDADESPEDLSHEVKTLIVTIQSALFIATVILLSGIEMYFNLQCYNFVQICLQVTL